VAGFTSGHGVSGLVRPSPRSFTAVVGRLDRTKLAETFDISAGRRVDGYLVSGSNLFGIGWGPSGSPLHPLMRLPYDPAHSAR